MKQIPSQFKKKPFKYNQAILEGYNQRLFKKQIEDGTFIPIFKGIYLFSKIDYNEETQFRVASLIVGNPSAICSISALYFYNLTDIIPKKTWILVPNKKRSSSRELQLKRHRNPKWKIGIHKNEGYCITNIERTIVEAIGSKGTTQIGIEALRRSILQKKTTLSSVIEMAEKLKVLNKILPYIQAFA